MYHSVMHVRVKPWAEKLGRWVTEVKIAIHTGDDPRSLSFDWNWSAEEERWIVTVRER